MNQYHGPIFGPFPHHVSEEDVSGDQQRLAKADALWNTGTLPMRLAAVRVAAGLTQYDLAEAGFSQSWVSQIERGAASPNDRYVSALVDRLESSGHAAWLTAGRSWYVLNATRQQRLETAEKAWNITPDLSGRIRILREAIGLTQAGMAAATAHYTKAPLNRVTLRNREQGLDAFSPEQIDAISHIVKLAEPQWSARYLRTVKGQARREQEERCPMPEILWSKAKTLGKRLAAVHAALGADRSEVAAVLEVSESGLRQQERDDHVPLPAHFEKLAAAAQAKKLSPEWQERVTMLWRETCPERYGDPDELWNRPQPLLGTKLEAMRAATGLRQLYFGQLVGERQMTVSETERGLRVPSAESLDRMVEVVKERIPTWWTVQKEAELHRSHRIVTQVERRQKADEAWSEGKRLKATRLALGIPESDFFALLGCGRSYYFKVEAGERPFTQAMHDAIAEAFPPKHGWFNAERQNALRAMMEGQSVASPQSAVTDEATAAVARGKAALAKAPAAQQAVYLLRIQSKRQASFDMPYDTALFLSDLLRVAQERGLETYGLNEHNAGALMHRGEVLNRNLMPALFVVCDAKLCGTEYEGYWGQVAERLAKEYPGQRPEREATSLDGRTKMVPGTEVGERVAEDRVSKRRELNGGRSGARGPA